MVGMLYLSKNWKLMVSFLPYYKLSHSHLSNYRQCDFLQPQIFTYSVNTEYFTHLIFLQNFHADCFYFLVISDKHQFIKLMSIENKNKYCKLKERLRTHQKNPWKEKVFNNRYSITENPLKYQALQDPHTAFYLANPSVRRHLKKLKKTIKRIGNPSAQQLHLTELIDRRLKQKFEGMIHPKTIIYQLEKTSIEKVSRRYLDGASASNGLVRCGMSSNKKKGIVNRTQSQGSTHINNYAINVLGKINEFEMQKSHSQKLQKQSRYANRLFDELHLKKHQKWTNFLQQKVKTIVLAKSNQFN